ncbi:gas vesicle protein GvpG [Halobium salinum]|uniref:Gas vesicle protein GvpG n=1 Tax=Halobium salinum TaxID=1364940 RepID=A0ABD5PH03_9EURY|nr:protein gvpG [Halobium salinum]
MILVDDLLVRPFFSILNILHSMAIEEMYDVRAISNELKENQLLYELGDRDTEEYERRKAELEAELEVAEAAHEQLSGRVEVRR